MKNCKKISIPTFDNIADELYAHGHLVLCLLVSLPSIIRSNVKK